MNRIALLIGALSLSAGPVLADEGNPSTTIELQFGSYRPDIDSAFDASTDTSRALPYEAAFSNERSTMVTISWERLISDAVGSLSFGFGIGYWSVEGAAVSPQGTPTEAEDTTALDILPLQAQLTYRFDVWAESIAIVPVVRVGIDYYLWEVLDGSGETAYFDIGGASKVNEASGGTY
jgi:hypothetical protein